MVIEDVSTDVLEAREKSDHSHVNHQSNTLSNPNQAEPMNM